MKYFKLKEPSNSSQTDNDQNAVQQQQHININNNPYPGSVISTTTTTTTSSSNNTSNIHQLSDLESQRTTTITTSSSSSYNVSLLTPLESNGTVRYLNLIGQPRYVDATKVSLFEKILVRFGWILEKPTKEEWIIWMKTTSVILLVICTLILAIELSIYGFAPPSRNAMLGPPTKASLDFGGMVAYLVVVKHQFYRFVMPLFLHSGFIHLLLNGWGLARFGVILEQRLGWKTMIILYFGANLGSSFMILAASGYTTVVVGASGALFGLTGCLLCEVLFGLEHLTEQQRKTALVNMCILLVTSFIISLSPGISLAGHFGGFVSGFCLGGILLITKPEKKRIRLTMVMALVAYFIITAGVGFRRS